MGRWETRLGEKLWCSPGVGLSCRAGGKSQGYPCLRGVFVVPAFLPGVCSIPSADTCAAESL